MATHTEIMKHYRDLVRNIESFSNGQASISEAPTGEEEEGEDSLTVLYVDVHPNDGPYKGGNFKFKFDLSDGYPEIGPPKINCLTRVYHPNIDQIDEYSEGDICLNLIDELWTPELTLEDFVQGLLFLFYNPNVEDPLNPAFHGGEELEEFEENIRRSMRGEEVDGIVYDKVIKETIESNEVDDATLNEPTTNTEQSSSDNQTTAVSNNETTESQIPSKYDGVLATPTRDEATGQHETTVLTTTLKEMSPSLAPRFLFFPFSANTKQLVKDVMHYSVAYILVRVGVFTGSYFLNRPITR